MKTIYVLKVKGVVKGVFEFEHDAYDYIWSGHPPADVTIEAWNGTRMLSELTGGPLGFNWNPPL
jgi:hypothetical protein